jgi:malonyl CoA-acyl carrier protein transacylase
MRVWLVVSIVAIAVCGLANAPIIASSPANADSEGAGELYTRVFYLQGMDVRQAVTLLRSQAQVLQVASINDRDVIVIAGTADMVERCETLLRERDAILRVAIPHEPVELEALSRGPLVSHVFRVTDNNIKTAVVVLRAIYQVRELSELTEDNTVSVRATQPVVDSSEALLRELGLLSDSTGERGV